MVWIEILGEFIQILTEYIVNPSSRLCLVYFVPSLFFSYSLTSKKLIEPNKTGVLRYYLGTSALQDYALIGLNTFLKVTLFSHLVVIGLDLAQSTYHFLYQSFGTFTLGLSPLWVVSIYTITLAIIDDLSVYLLHRWMHHSPLLWSFHSVHHSAEFLTPLTWLRIHPVEMLLNTSRRAFVYGLTTGGFMFISGGAVSELSFLGVNIISLIFFVMGANLRHSHIPITYGSRLETILISPIQHQIHHSSDPQHINHNFGSKFALWDLLFGTLIKGEMITRPLNFGNDQTVVNEQQ